ncbi:hypothetical protein N0V90_002638 [Kalmusia sp. IMI 367209]|nr:hypothetical protein N0V90_002638 [Kalmusia sp. IMI 367209]
MQVFQRLHSFSQSAQPQAQEQAQAQAQEQAQAQAQAQASAPQHDAASREKRAELSEDVGRTAQTPQVGLSSSSADGPSRDKS